MFERFTDRARRVVVLAQEEARRLDHNYIGTEHILLGLVAEAEGVAGRALDALGISLEEVRREVEAIIGPGEGRMAGHIPFTPRAKKVLELSLREALQLGHNYIGTEHILLGLIREGEGVAAQVLEKLGAGLDRVRQQVIQLLSGQGGERVRPSLRRKRGETVGVTLGAEEGPGIDVEAEPGPATPRCPRCRAAVERAGSRTIDLEGAEGEEAGSVTVLFCLQCGAALGIVPGGSG